MGNDKYTIAIFVDKDQRRAIQEFLFAYFCKQHSYDNKRLNTQIEKRKTKCRENKTNCRRPQHFVTYNPYNLIKKQTMTLDTIYDFLITLKDKLGQLETYNDPPGNEEKKYVFERNRDNYNFIKDHISDAVEKKYNILKEQEHGKYQDLEPIYTCVYAIDDPRQPKHILIPSVYNEKKFEFTNMDEPTACSVLDITTLPSYSIRVFPFYIRNKWGNSSHFVENIQTHYYFERNKDTKGVEDENFVIRYMDDGATVGKIPNPTIDFTKDSNGILEKVNYMMTYDIIGISEQDVTGLEPNYKCTLDISQQLKSSHNKSLTADSNKHKYFATEKTDKFLGQKHCDIYMFKFDVNNETLLFNDESIMQFEKLPNKSEWRGVTFLKNKFGNKSLPNVLQELIRRHSLPFRITNSQEQSQTEEGITKFYFVIPFASKDKPPPTQGGKTSRSSKPSFYERTAQLYNYNDRQYRVYVFKPAYRGKDKAKKSRFIRLNNKYVNVDTLNQKKKRERGVDKSHK
jgi:hypothetical protein